MKDLGLYIHIPFCEKKCRYCGFYSLAGCAEEIKSKYVKAALKEIEEMLSYFGDGDKEGYLIDSIFIGGGTPSSLDARHIVRILESVKSLANVSKDAEISIETNPGTLSLDKLKAYKEAGINRISMGVQSLDDDILKKYGRIHNAQDVYKNFEDIRKAGFENVNLDLMFGLPGQTMKIWEETLNKAIKLEPEHMSFYSLQLEEGTPIFEDFLNGKFQQVSDELDREEYHRGIEVLESFGYEHYEISNMAKPNKQCRHNLKYWSFKDYLGIGCGASSFMKGTRFSNKEDIETYTNYWNGKDSNNPFSETYIENLLSEYTQNTLEDSCSEYTFTALRKKEGLNLADFKENFGIDFFKHFSAQKEIVENYAKTGHVILDESSLRLTTLGFDISNQIMAEFV